MVYSTASNPGRGKMKKRRKRKKGGRRCTVRHVVKCRGGKKRRTRRKGGKRRTKGKRGGKYSSFVKAMWRKHRSKLKGMGGKRAMRWIASKWKK